MTQTLTVLWPEILLVTVGSLLLLLGVVQSTAARRAAPIIAFATLVVVLAVSPARPGGGPTHPEALGGPVSVYAFQEYVKLITAGIGILLVLLASPTNSDATGNPSIHYGHETGEFFGL